MNKPFFEVVGLAQQTIDQGAHVLQSWHCPACGAKQMMEEKNTFFTSGCCEECGYTSDFQRDGCGFMAVWDLQQPQAGGPPPPRY